MASVEVHANDNCEMSTPSKIGASDDSLFETILLRNAMIFDYLFDLVDGAVAEPSLADLEAARTRVLSETRAMMKSERKDVFETLLLWNSFICENLFEWIDNIVTNVATNPILPPPSRQLEAIKTRVDDKTQNILELDCLKHNSNDSSSSIARETTPAHPVTNGEPSTNPILGVPHLPDVGNVVDTLLVWNSLLIESLFGLIDNVVDNVTTKLNDSSKPEQDSVPSNEAQCNNCGVDVENFDVAKFIDSFTANRNNSSKLDQVKTWEILFEESKEDPIKAKGACHSADSPPSSEAQCDGCGVAEICHSADSPLPNEAKCNGCGVAVENFDVSKFIRECKEDLSIGSSTENLSIGSNDDSSVEDDDFVIINK